MQMKEQWRKILKKVTTFQMDGIGVVEIILILVILIGLVVIFKDNITEIINNAFESITNDASAIIN
ncbi:MAG: hypothetical protein GX306_07760 [Clostridiales bacterium]|jgi:hypothetical protein|nr:hypothetical protein [Clostridiales bacterium]